MIVLAMFTLNIFHPGRLLGNFYSRAGRNLEKGLGRVVNRTAIKEYEQMVAALRSGVPNELFASEDPTEREKACEILIICAKCV